MSEKINFDELCQKLKSMKVQSIYLIHEEDKEESTREFAKKLKEQGFTTIVAADHRKLGVQSVHDAIKECQLSLVMAFDDKAVRKALDSGVPYFYHVED